MIKLEKTAAVLVLNACNTKKRSVQETQTDLFELYHRT
jgi:hypothetical protein